MNWKKFVLLGYVVACVFVAATSIVMIGFVVSTVSTRSLFSITSVFRSFRSITHLPTTRIRMEITRTDTADTVIRAAMAMDPRLCSCNAGWLGRGTTMVLLTESWDRQRDGRFARTNAPTIRART